MGRLATQREIDRYQILHSQFYRMVFGSLFNETSAGYFSSRAGRLPEAKTRGTATRGRFLPSIVTALFPQKDFY
jgi:hypothetical protein